jgi:hypothetical protein
MSSHPAAATSNHIPWDHYPQKSRPKLKLCADLREVNVVPERDAALEVAAALAWLAPEVSDDVQDAMLPAGECTVGGRS